MVKLIVAMDRNNLIGNNDKLPWHIKEELAFFKKTTLNHNLLMGRRTFDSLPGTLPQRKIFVFSRSSCANAFQTLKSVAEVERLLEKFRNSEAVLFIAGGKHVYERFYPYAEEIIVSKVKSACKGNVYLSWSLSNYQSQKTLSRRDFDVYVYTRSQNS